MNITNKGQRDAKVKEKRADELYRHLAEGKRQGVENK